MAKDYSRSERYIREATSRIDKDLKVELRETAFNLWMECRTQDEIAEAVGFSRQAIGEFLNSLQDARNGTGAESSDLSENPELTNTDDREFDDEEQDDSNSLGVYKLDKRLLIKANHMDEYFKPPIYNVWKQQSKTAGVNHFGNSEVRWLACHTQEEIAEAVDVPQQTIADWMKDFTETSITEESVKWTDFETPIYNIWKQQSKTAGVNHFGNSEVRWLDNLLYLYTNPADIVVDPFAGSGSTIDLCKKRQLPIRLFRRRLAGLSPVNFHSAHKKRPIRGVFRSDILVHSKHG